MTEQERIEFLEPTEDEKIADLERENKKLRDDVKEWRKACDKYIAANALLTKQVYELLSRVPVWHFVTDGDLPSDKRNVIAISGFAPSEPYVDNYLGFYHDEHHWRVHDDVVKWCEMPNPLTEEGK